MTSTQIMGADIVIRNFDSNLPLNIDRTEPITDEISTLKKIKPDYEIFAGDHLIQAKPYISKNIVSSEKFSDILNVANNFPSSLTSFLGFETRLGNNDPRVDWAFAISGMGKDRKILSNHLNSGFFPENLIEKTEWKQISEFAKVWADEESILNNKIQCFWLEFDMPEKLSEIPTPSIFFGPTKLPRNVANNDISRYEWLTRTALPILKGQFLSEELEEKILDCIKKMPKNSTLFQVGTMLSRTKNFIRLHINKIKPSEITDYLKKIGYNHDIKQLESLINEIENKADRFVVSYDITNKGVAPRIGIELSFVSDKFQNETRWNEILDYLVKKGLCTPEKKDALLDYQGMETNDDFTGGIMKPVISASKNLKDSSISYSRYINHIKIVYEPGKDMIAKAYPAIRLFEKQEQTSKMKLE